MLACRSFAVVLRFGLLILLLGGSGCDATPGAELAQLTASINGGQLEAGFPAIGAVIADGRRACSGTLIGPRSVLTAAHCIEDTSNVVFYPRAVSSEMRVASRVQIHPDYDEHQVDLAVLTLASAVEGIEPLPVAVGVPHVGDSVVMVGLGKVSETEGHFGTKRTRVATIGALPPGSLALVGLCDGDSGGPTLAARDDTLVVVGVHRAKQRECAGRGYDVRVDMYRSFIAEAAPDQRELAPEALEIISPVAGAQTRSRLRVVAAVSPDDARATIEFIVDGRLLSSVSQPPYQIDLKDLPTGVHRIQTKAVWNGKTLEAQATVTVADEAVRLPFGDACQTAAQCEGGLCVQGICSRSCRASAPCESGYACRDAVCQPMALCADELCGRMDSPTERPTSGCAVASTPNGEMSSLLVLLLALVWRSRRR
ncbi:MAG: trypsin-like serine protease [Deltaproteobacteria bacterium]|nr:trypsin-like serine protease [Deltaproteobacteria bacterium]